MYRQAWQMSRRLRGDNHPETGDSFERLTSVLTDLGHYEEAEPFYRQYLALEESLFCSGSAAVRATLKLLIRHHESEGGKDKSAAY